MWPFLNDQFTVLLDLWVARPDISSFQDGGIDLDQGRNALP
jgi:hypothetical protein